MSKLCFGCMQQKENSPICEHCGYEETRQNLPHQLPVGTLLQNQYLIGRVLGQGGFGITYMGWDQHLSVPVAIKEYFPSGVVHRHRELGTEVICETGISSDSFQRHKDRFLKEARTLAMLSDIPQIVQVKNYFSENGTAYIVMEYVHGITLKTYLKQLGRPMTESELLEIIAPMLTALQKVHDQHLIHRDISPDNIMLPFHGGVKLIDFGTVRYIEDSGASKSTESVLKPGFAPMEQYHARGNLGTWTDVYALSATFHFLLTGKIPPDVHERMDTSEELTLLRQNPHISSTLIHALELGMKLRAKDRLQTVDDLYRMLYEADAAPAVPADAAPEPAPAEQAVSEKNSRKKKTPLLLVGGIAAALAAALLLSGPKAQTPEETASVFAPESLASSETASPDVLQIRYNYGISLLDSGMYAQAMETFAALGSYLDSEDGYRYAEAALLESDGHYGKAAIAFAKISSFRDSKARSLSVWKFVPGRSTRVLEYGNDGDVLLHGLRQDGSVAVDSLNGRALSGYSVSQYRDLVSIHGVIGLKYDGTLVLPEETDPLIQSASLSLINHYRSTLLSWTDVVSLSVDSNYNCILGILADGHVVAVGYDDNGKVQAAQWTNIRQIVQESTWAVGLRSDGTVVALGNNSLHQCDVGEWMGIIDIAVGSGVTMGLRQSGNVICAGTNTHGTISLSNLWVNIAELENGPYGIMANGQVQVGFYDHTGKRDNAKNWSSIVSIAGNAEDAIGLLSDGTLVFSRTESGTFPLARTWKDLQLP
ncbi:MAG: protein kinase [Oscillospiraceae bacterium]|nr:protein kinase [Oscillospiraceae bacterium]